MTLMRFVWLSFSLFEPATQQPSNFSHHAADVFILPLRLLFGTGSSIMRCALSSNPCLKPASIPTVMPTGWAKVPTAL